MTEVTVTKETRTEKKVKEMEGLLRLFLFKHVQSWSFSPPKILNTGGGELLS